MKPSLIWMYFLISKDPSSLSTFSSSTLSWMPPLSAPFFSIPFPSYPLKHLKVTVYLSFQMLCSIDTASRAIRKQGKGGQWWGGGRKIKVLLLSSCRLSQRSQFFFCLFFLKFPLLKKNQTLGNLFTLHLISYCSFTLEHLAISFPISYSIEAIF